jgi:molybdate transport system permease protein
MPQAGDAPGARPRFRAGSDALFFGAFAAIGGAYVLLIVAMLAADALYTTPDALLAPLSSPDVRYSIALSLVSCTLSAVLSVLVAVPTGYLLSRHDFRGKHVVDSIIDIPIVLPPLVIGLSLLILFQTPPGKACDKAFKALVELLGVNDLLGLLGVKPIRGITFEIPAVVIAQCAVACAFAVRTMRVAFGQIDARRENVALTLGCRRSQAFFRVVLPEARAGVVTAFTLAWARSLGEFGPILVFAGATRGKTEVLPSTVFLALTVGDITEAVSVSLIMVTAAMAVLVVTRFFGLRRGFL